MKENKLNFINDYLLLDPINSKNFITTNNLISNRKDLITLSNNTLNLYTALVKRIDFSSNHLRVFPFFKIHEDKFVELLPSSYKNSLYYGLRKYLSFYLNRKRIIRTESIKLWLENEIFPAPMIRVISNIVSSSRKEELDNLSLLTKTIEFVTDSKLSSTINLPKTMKELKNPDLAYFVGCSFGDGELNTAEHWQLVDGDSEDVESSLKFIDNLKLIANSLFKLEFSKNNPRLRGNKYEFWISNKSLCRFLNFFFGMPYGKKKNKIEKPKIFNILPNSPELTKMFWKGMFDTDGCLEKEGYRVTLSSATNKIVEDCRKDLKAMGLLSKIRLVKSTGVNLLHVDSTSFQRFGFKIGFSHPRKNKTYQIKNEKYLTSQNRKRL